MLSINKLYEKENMTNLYSLLSYITLCSTYNAHFFNLLQKV